MRFSFLLIIMFCFVFICFEPELTGRQKVSDDFHLSKGRLIALSMLNQAFALPSECSSIIPRDVYYLANIQKGVHMFIQDKYSDDYATFQFLDLSQSQWKKKNMQKRGFQSQRTNVHDDEFDVFIFNLDNGYTGELWCPSEIDSSTCFLHSQTAKEHNYENYLWGSMFFASKYGAMVDFIKCMQKSEARYEK